MTRMDEPEREGVENGRGRRGGRTGPMITGLGMTSSGAWAASWSLMLNDDADGGVRGAPASLGSAP